MTEGREAKIHALYKALVGETFSGTFIGTFDRRDSTSKTWLKIRIDAMSPQMKDGLQAIVDSFEGCIWKGFHEGVMYIDFELHPRSIQEAERFQIQDFQVLSFHKACKEPEKYSYQYGCCFILGAV